MDAAVSARARARARSRTVWSRARRFGNARRSLTFSCSRALALLSRRVRARSYAALYSTAHGHFLCYYADVTDSPLFSDEPRERNVVDLCKVCFIRPSSRARDAPPHAFDVVTIEREWTLAPAPPSAGSAAGGGGGAAAAAASRSSTPLVLSIGALLWVLVLVVKRRKSAVGPGGGRRFR